MKSVKITKVAKTIFGVDMKIKHAISSICVAAGLVVTSQVWAIELDVASTFPKDMLFLGDGPKHFARAVEQISDGDIKINIHGAGDLVPALEVFNAVSTGAVHAGYDWVGYWGGIIPVTNLVGSLPFGPTPDVLAGWIWEGGGMEIIQKAYDPHNVKFLPCVNVPGESAGWFNKEIRSVEDLKGLKMRIGGLGGRVMNKLGTSTQMIPGGEVYVSLERGRIDAAEFGIPAIDESIQLQNAAKYFYFPGWHQPASINSISFNLQTWNGLSELQRGQILTACRSSYLWTLTYGIPEQIAALDRLEKGGTQIRRLPDQVLDALRVATNEVIKEERKNDPIFDEAYSSLSDYMADVNRWEKMQDVK